MKPNPLVSIITPSYNQGRFVEQTILSVLNQSYQNIEYIIVDGDSNDNTLSVIKQYENKINTIISEKDEGQADAINKGFKIAKGELIGWLNSDDILYEDCVNNIVKAYNNNTHAAIYFNSKIDLIDKEGEIFGSIKKQTISKETLLHKDYDIIQQGSFYNKKYFNRIEKLDKKLNYCFDLDLWLNLLSFGDIIDIYQEKHAAFRIWEETKTSTGKQKFLHEILKVLKRHGAKNYYMSINKARWRIILNNIKDIIKNENSTCSV